MTTLFPYPGAEGNDQSECVRVNEQNECLHCLVVGIKCVQYETVADHTTQQW